MVNGLSSHRRRLAVVMSVDVVGYVSLMQADEHGTYAKLMACRASIIAPAVSRASGEVVKGTGDGVLAEFPNVVAACMCALEIQRAMGEESATTSIGEHLSLRIGLAVGDVLVEPGDIYGETVNLAARLQAEARPGGICVGQAVRDSAAAALGSAIRFVPIGARALKHMVRPLAAWHLEAADARPGDLSRPPIWDIPGVAVMPFETPAGDVEGRILADGLADDLIAALGSCRWFPVIARQTSFIYRDSHLAPQQIAQELGAGYLVHGLFRRAGAHVRLSFEGSAGAREAGALQVVCGDGLDATILFRLANQSPFPVWSFSPALAPAADSQVLAETVSALVRCLDIPGKTVSDRRRARNELAALRLPADDPASFGRSLGVHAVGRAAEGNDLGHVLMIRSPGLGDGRPRSPRTPSGRWSRRRWDPPVSVATGP